MGFRSWVLSPLVSEILAADTTGDWFVAFKDAIEANKSRAGIVVTQENAMQLPAVYRSVTLNCDTIATLPWSCKAKRGSKRVDYPEPVWFKEPTDDLNWSQFLGQMQASLELDGNAYALKASTTTGALVGLYPLAPSAVKVRKDTEGRKIFLVAQDSGEEKPFASTSILHVPGFMMPGALTGLSPIACAKQTIGIGLAAEQFGAQFFGTGATLSGVIENPAPLTPEKVKQLEEQFKRKHGGISKSHALGILSGGAKWVPLSVKPEEAQFLQTRRYSAVEIAHMHGVPPEEVTDTEGAKGYVTSLYMRQYMWLITGINPRLKRLEDAFSALLPRPAYIKANRNAFLAMDPKERSEFYSKGLTGRYIVPNQIRELEDWDPLEDGDEPLWSVQWVSPSAEKDANQGAVTVDPFDDPEVRDEP